MWWRGADLTEAVDRMEGEEGEVAALEKVFEHLANCLFAEATKSCEEQRQKKLELALAPHRGESITDLLKVRFNLDGDVCDLCGLVMCLKFRTLSAHHRCGDRSSEHQRKDRAAAKDAAGYVLVHSP